MPRNGEYNAHTMRRRLLVAAGLLLALSGVVLSAGSAYAYFWDRGRADLIAPGVRIAGVEVGGLHASEARALLERRVVTGLERPIRLRADTHSFVVDPAGVGLRVHLAPMIRVAVRASRSGGLGDRLLRSVEGRRLRLTVPLRAAFSHAVLDTVVRNVASVVDRPPQNARVVPSAASLRIVPGHDGIAVSRDVLRRELAATLLRVDGPRTLDVPTRPVPPRWSAATLTRRYSAFILVDRESFTLRLFRHLKLAKTYPIAVGRSGLETPAGLYKINDKEVNPSWHVPDSPWAGSLAGRTIPPGDGDPIKARWLGFWDGAGIHGTVDTWSLGHAASHGCIRMSIPDVEELYALTPMNTPIYVG
jgi:lipoprotein-anchoring transpeptidase ErfK/SrfK